MLSENRGAISGEEALCRGSIHAAMQAALPGKSRPCTGTTNLVATVKISDPVFKPEEAAGVSVNLGAISLERRRQNNHATVQAALIWRRGTANLAATVKIGDPVMKLEVMVSFLLDFLFSKNRYAISGETRR